MPLLRGKLGSKLPLRLVKLKLGNQAQMDMQLYPGEVRVLPIIM